MNFLNKALIIKFATVSACILAGTGIDAMQQEKATWHTVPFELQLNIWGGAENNNFCAKIRLLNIFRLVCRSWNSALRNNSNLKAFFEQLFLKNFTESQCKAVINFVSFVLSDQNLNPVEKIFLKRLYNHFKMGTSTLAQLVNHNLPLHDMAEEGADKAALCLLILGANKEAQQDITSWTPLHCAAGNDHLEIVRLLLAQHANKDVQDIFGRTALHRAALHGYLEIVKLLLSHNVNTESRTNNKGLYPNMTAADIAHEEYSGTGKEVYKQIFNLLKSS